MTQALPINSMWMGMLDGEKLVELLSNPWPAGSDIFVLIQEPGKPETADCVDFHRVRPFVREKKVA